MDSAAIFMSPKRVNGFSVDPSNYTPSPPLGDATIYPWNWGSKVASPDACCSSPDTPSRTPNNDANLKRGRPRADSISNLIEEGSRTKSPLQCNVCTRVFPRDKSLQAHMRTHTGERPYLCDYPSCGKSFCQSGQLKTHQRLHTGEKPFICSHPGCVKRFTHANRHCSEHPYATLERDRQSDACSEPDPLVLAGSSPQIQKWLHLYYAQRTPLKPKSSSQATGTKRSLHLDIENEYAIETKRRAGLTLPVTPLGTSNSPIKRAPPNTPEKLNPHIKKQRLIEQFDKSSENQDTLLGALALMELAHGPM